MGEIRSEIIVDLPSLRELENDWEDLRARSGGGPFLSFRWIDAWWRAYRGVDALWVATLRDDEGLIAAWPLHLKAPRSAVRHAELQLIGDAAGAEESLLCRPESVELAIRSFAELLLGQGGWDLLDVPIGGEALAARFEAAFSARSAKAQRLEVVGRWSVALPAKLDGNGSPESRPCRLRAEVAAKAALPELLRFLRRDSTDAGGAWLADPHLIEFLTDAVPDLIATQRGRIDLLERDDGELVGTGLVIRDGSRHVQLLGVGDLAAQQALAAHAHKASLDEGAERFELVGEASPISAIPAKALRLQAWNATTSARLLRGVASIRSVVSSAESLRPLERLREAAPEVVQRVLARVAGLATLHLYRGELFSRSASLTSGLELGLFGRSDFDALDGVAQTEFTSRLDLQPSYCLKKWDRGDTVVVARAAGLPVGIVWCARSTVYVPDIDREVKPGPGECYIHDVYVHPDERGRQVAPAMLDFLARDLRHRDVYRAWALIERSNLASTRAFEKAAYASVADVIYARMGLVRRLSVRPPDPEARAFLGLA